MADPASWHSHVCSTRQAIRGALIAAIRDHFGPDAAIAYGRWHPGLSARIPISASSWSSRMICSPR